MWCVVIAACPQQQIHERQVENLVADLAARGTITAAQQQSYIYGTDTGTPDAYAVTLAPAPTIVEGSVVVVKIANTNTGSATLSVNGSGTTTTTTVTTPPAPTPPPPSGSTVVVKSVHNLDEITTGWKTCAIGACGGGTPGGTNSPSSYSITFGHSSPSVDGNSALIQQTTVAGAKQTNILFIKSVGTCPGCTWIHTHKRLYVDTTGGTPNNVEADSYIVRSKVLRMDGLQCNLTKHVWQIANDHESWVDTPKSCAGFSMNAWHEVEAVYHSIDGDTGCGGYGCLHYDWLAVDGDETQLNMVRPSDPPHNWADGLADQYQCDIAGGSKTCKIYIDDAWIEGGTGTPPTGSISTGTPTGGGTTTTTTTTTGTTIGKFGGNSLAAGDLAAGQIAVFVFDGQIWQLLNPATSSGSGGSGGGSTSTWFQEIPSGTADGSNLDFYLTYSPASPYVILTENGVTQNPYTQFALAGNHIHMSYPPRSTDDFVIWYFAGAAAGDRSGDDPASGGTFSGTPVSVVLNAWVAYPKPPCGVPEINISFDGGTSFHNDTFVYPTLPFNRTLLTQAWSGGTVSSWSALSNLEVNAQTLYNGCSVTGGAQDQLWIYDLAVVITNADGSTQTVRPTAFTGNGGPDGGTFTNIPNAFDLDLSTPITYGYLSQPAFGVFRVSGTVIFSDWQ